jgi:hypothetical protein
MVFFGKNKSVLNKIVSLLLPIFISSTPLIKGKSISNSIIPYVYIGPVLEQYFADSECNFSYDCDMDRILLLSSHPQETYEVLGDLFFRFLQVTSIHLVEESIYDNIGR